VTERSETTIRLAGPEDVDEVAAVFLACWQVSYDRVLPRPVVAMYDADGARALWRAALLEAGPDSVALVAEDGGGAISGVVRVGTDPDRPAAGHIFSLYVDPARQGRGVGTLLLAAAEARISHRGADEATLWVFEENVAARAFYDRLGWQPDGGRRTEPEYGEPEIRLRRTFRSGTGRT
jgi:ribosomal protein S18 acetylase RimI-like enzyme